MAIVKYGKGKLTGQLSTDQLKKLQEKLDKEDSEKEKEKPAKDEKKESG